MINKGKREKDKIRVSGKKPEFDSSSRSTSFLDQGHHHPTQHILSPLSRDRVLQLLPVKVYPTSNRKHFKSLSPADKQFQRQH